MAETAEFAGKVALVTGALGALGAVVAWRFFAAGAGVVLPDRKPEWLAGEFPELTSAPDRAFAHPCEITEPDSVEGLVAAAVARFGRIDALANVAGAFRGGAARRLL